MVDYALIWAGLIAFAVLAYIILDGFDLGIGIMSPFIKEKEDRETAMNTIAPIWDGNETWLVLGGGGLFAVFPLAYSIILPALYMPIILMLLGLIFRGVAFEFHWRATKSQHLWDKGFAIGSLVAALCQGIALGALVQGIAVDGRDYAGGWWDWLTPFSLTTGIALAVGYVLLGATWLNMKTTGSLQKQSLSIAKIAGVATFGFIGLISLWMVFIEQQYLHRWFDTPNIYYLSVIPILVLIVGVSLFLTLKKKREVSPFLLSISLFLLSYIGLAVSFFPNLVPPSISLWQAAAPDSSLKFLLVGAAFLLPIILAYTTYAYWVFRGKVKEGEAYH
ncbi:cytochrome d ubiquinol oxidase subunit II [Kangiella spongicola]|uniref:Cytochrome d ubiquinol oxidase subunit II n=1 Tax=Kangiella spongicola TaxID=796379 RepID=A0A318D335_9GAMM|nr:cytochrome d ubiquinol oxidase subunit II [Kangiella spongicola]PXF63590.1 cytochrome d ubiquinol oxidase subunit II [Kangiella spongicola]